MKSQKKWTDDEVALVKIHYPCVGGSKYLQKALGRTERSIKHKANKIGVIGPRERPFIKHLQVYATEQAAKKNKGSLAHGKNRIGPDNIGAKAWQFENKALGVVISGTNLSHLVRDNSFLFSAEDVKEDRYGRTRKCRACVCLRNLSKEKNAPNSWKGWVFLRKSPGTVGDSLDFIGVRDQETIEAMIPLMAEVPG